VKRWVEANTTWVSRFSAICYLSARDALASGGHAVGLIETDYGGTPIQAWSPPDALEACGAPLDDCDGKGSGIVPTLTNFDISNTKFKHASPPFTACPLLLSLD